WPQARPPILLGCSRAWLHVAVHSGADRGEAYRRPASINLAGGFYSAATGASEGLATLVVAFRNLPRDGEYFMTLHTLDRQSDRVCRFGSWYVLVSCQSFRKQQRLSAVRAKY